MHTPVTIITDKVMRMLGSAVYFALCATGRGGATVGEITGLLSTHAPGAAALYHEGMVERVLRQLQSDGRVDRAGAQWRPVIDA